MTTHEPVYYHDYLGLDQLLDTQHPESGRTGPAAHDEMLFIIVHQAYELWFKQILHELEAVWRIFDQPAVPERDMGRVVGHLERIVAVQRVTLGHLDVLETMTPLDFLEFRDALVPASGFQSLQFRLIENMLGLRPDERIPINEAAYTTRFSAEHAAVLAASHERASLFDLVEDWLERTPFLQFGDFDFWSTYQVAVDRMAQRDRTLILTNANLTDAGRAQQLERFDRAAAGMEALFDESRYAEAQANGNRRMSRSAFLAALFINLYRDEPIVHLPFRVLQSLIDVDEGFTTWRYRHSLMVQRMIGRKIGTGGTSGHDYLRDTAMHHRVWRDLFDLPSYFIPRHELPSLPERVAEAMRFQLQVVAPAAATGNAAT